MAVAFLDFEQPIAELEAKIEELKHITSDSEVNIRDEITRLQAKSRQLTTHIFASLTPWQITQLARHPHRPYTLDYVNVMSYDFKEGGDSLSGHHTNLLGSPDDPSHRSTDQAIKDFEAAGVPAAKLVVGIAFYGHGWKMKTDDNHGLYRPSTGPFRVHGGYTYIKDSLVGQDGYHRYWDRKAKAPYLFQPQEKIFISYDDERSVKAKCKYTEKNQLAGVMFWEYFADRKGYLLNEIDKTLKH